MGDYELEIDNLLREAASLPYGQTRFELLEEAVRVADLHGDLDRGYEARRLLMSAAMFTGRSDVVLTSFAWSVAMFDRYPGRFDERSLLWRYKWVTIEAQHFPTVSRAKIEELLNDMERRYATAGHSLHGAAQMRRGLYVDMNDVTASRQAHERLQRIEVDSMSDCAACLRANEAEYFALQKQWERQLEILKPVLDGQLTCGEEPITSASRAMLTLLCLGRGDEARALQRRYVKDLTSNRVIPMTAGLHVTFLSLIGDLAAAKRLFERFLPAAMSAVARDYRLKFFRSGVVWLDLLGRKQQFVKMKSHAQLPPPDAKGQHEIAALREWMYHDALSIAHEYDARNGNDGETQNTEGLAEMIEELAVA